MIKTKVLITVCLLGIIILTGCQTPNTHQQQATICLFFDDAWANQYEETLPVLLEHEFTATFGVITGRIGTGENFWRYMNEDELKNLADHGMDIACHTKTHPHLTDNLTDEQLREEIIESKKYLESLDFEINTMVYPYYEWDDRVIEYVIEAGYGYARGGWPEEGSFNLPLADDDARYHLPSRQITSQDLETFKSIVGELDDNSAICLVYHFISDTGPETTSTPVDNFHEQMAYLKEAGFKVVVLSDIIE